jgi:hypothetical protein
MIFQNIWDSGIPYLLTMGRHVFYVHMSSSTDGLSLQVGLCVVSSADLRPTIYQTFIQGLFLLLPSKQ